MTSLWKPLGVGAIELYKVDENQAQISLKWSNNFLIKIIVSTSFKRTVLGKTESCI